MCSVSACVRARARSKRTVACGKGKAWHLFLSLCSVTQGNHNLPCPLLLYHFSPHRPVRSRAEIKARFRSCSQNQAHPAGSCSRLSGSHSSSKDTPHAASLPHAAPRCQPSSYASVCAASFPDFRVAEDSPLDSRIPELLHFSGGRKGVRDATAEGPTILGRYLLGEAAGTAGSLAWVWIQGILRELALQRAQRCVWGHTRGKNLLECPPHPRPTVSAPVKPFFSREV